MFAFRPQFRCAAARLFSSLLSPLSLLPLASSLRPSVLVILIHPIHPIPPIFQKIRGKIRFFTYKPDIFGHFLPLIWVKWAMLYSFFTKYRHFVRQSLNTPPPLPGHFRTFPDKGVFN